MPVVSVSNTDNSRKMFKLWPSRKQWNRWTLPSKAGFIGCVVGIIGLPAMFLLWIYSPFSGQSQDRVDLESSPPLVEGVMPLHLWSRGLIPELERHYFEHRLALIAKINNPSDLGVAVDVALLEGCVGIEPFAAEGTLPPSERFPSGTPMKDIITRHEHTVQRIRVSGLIRRDSRHVPAGGLGYVGILFPFPAGRSGASLLGEPGSISLKGNCEEIEKSNSQPSVQQIFEAVLNRKYPKGLAKEIRDGRARFSLSIGSAKTLLEPSLIKKLVSIRWKNWENLGLLI